MIKMEVCELASEFEYFKYCCMVIIVSMMMTVVTSRNVYYKSTACI